MKPTKQYLSLDLSFSTCPEGTGGMGIAKDFLTWDHVTSRDGYRIALLRQLSGVLAKVTCSPLPYSLAVRQSSVSNAQERSSPGTRGG